MPFSIARTWLDDKGVDLALYLMYDAVQVVRKEVIEQRPDIKEAVDYLLSRGARSTPVASAAGPANSTPTATIPG
jgi:hypothetical protein